MQYFLEGFSGSTALFAALLWYWSASIKTPDNIGSFGSDYASFDSGLYSQHGSTAISPKLNDDFKAFLKALKRQSRLSAGAAILAGFSATAQCIIMFMKVVH